MTSSFQMRPARPPSRRFKAAALLAFVLTAAGCASSPSGPAQADAGYPTLDRVRYVQECMRDNPGPSLEMTDKCVCAIDRIAERVPHAEYMAMITATYANSIGGERGSYIRDVKILQDDIRRYRTLQQDVQKACFIGVGIRE